MNTTVCRVFGSLALALCACGTAFADYVAYSVGENDRSPLPERLDGIDAKYLVNIEWGDYGGRKSRLGVLEVDNTSSTSSFRVTSAGSDIDYSASSMGVPVNGIEAIVIDSLARTDRFRLVERTVLSDVLGEQDLASSGRIAKPSGAATGNVLGAEYLVQVVVTDYETNTSGKGGGVGGLLTKRVPLLGGVKVKSGSGRVGLNIRLIDAETSEIVFTKQIESIIKESGLAFGGVGFTDGLGLGGFLSQYAKTPVGQAVIAGVNQGVFELIKEIGSKGAAGSVVKADQSQVYLNLGADAVSPGERLEIREKGEELIDPETGLSLGGSDKVLGEVEVVQVEEKFSIARPLSLATVPARGAKAVSLKPAAALEFANNFNEPK